MYLFHRNPYVYNKKYSTRTRVSKSIENIVSERFEQQKMYNVLNKLNTKNKENHVNILPQKVQEDYTAFGLTRKFRQITQGSYIIKEISEIRANIDFQQNFKQTHKNGSKKTRNRIKLQPLKVKISERRYFPEYLESPGELNQELRPRFIV